MARWRIENLGETNIISCKYDEAVISIEPEVDQATRTTAVCITGFCQAQRSILGCFSHISSKCSGFIWLDKAREKHMCVKDVRPFIKRTNVQDERQLR